uniref:Uncharacterized protein n=1 Tax=Arundo donax TaxID=35708 RepID=A0A0A9EKY9_ARUDO
MTVPLWMSSRSICMICISGLILNSASPILSSLLKVLGVLVKTSCLGNETIIHNLHPSGFRNQTCFLMAPVFIKIRASVSHTKIRALCFSRTSVDYARSIRVFLIYCFICTVTTCFNRQCRSSAFNI